MGILLQFYFVSFILESLLCEVHTLARTVKPRFIYLIAGTSDDWNRGFDRGPGLCNDTLMFYSP